MKNLGLLRARSFCINGGIFLRRLLFLRPADRLAPKSLKYNHGHRSFIRTLIILLLKYRTSCPPSIVIF